MEKNLVFSVEPGLYFINPLLNQEIEVTNGINFDFINKEKLEEYKQEVVGFRIEEVVLITEDGHDILSGWLPRTAEEIEVCMTGKDWHNL